MIRDKILVEKDLRIIKDDLKGLIGLVEELENYIEEMEFKK